MTSMPNAPIPLPERVSCDYRLLVVDLDGALVDTEPLHVRSYELILTALRGEPIRLNGAEIIGRREPDIWRGLSVVDNPELDASCFQELRRYVFLGLCAEEPPAKHERVWAIVAAFAGSRVLLTSQSAHLARWILRSLGAEETFEAILSTQTTGGPATKYSLIRRLLADHSISPNDLLWIEDASPEIDEVRALGVSVAVVRRDYNSDIQQLGDWIIP
jgi:beta-phosphoglucomutase-like phosphatase (HAD superfamily)